VAPGSVVLLPSQDAAVGARYLIDVSAQRKGNVSTSEPLVRYGQLSFESVEQAIRGWIPLRPFYGHSDGRLGKVIVEMPLAAPRFGPLEMQGNQLRIHVDQSARNARPELTGVWQAANASRIEPFAEKVNGAAVTVPRPDWAERVALWLALPDSLVTDYYFEDAMQCSRDRRVLFPTAQEEGNDPASMLAQIYRGESQDLEFKPFIEPEHPKFKELIRTVIAFANKHGGAIFLGVDKHQEIEGIDGPLRNWAPVELKPSLEQCAARYCAVIRTKVCDDTSNIDFDAQPVRLGEKLLVRVKVTEGKHKPYVNVHTNDLWTRRGSNTVRPRPDELQQLVNGANPQLFNLH
jgi:hypothetical protein